MGERKSALKKKYSLNVGPSFLFCWRVVRQSTIVWWLRSCLAQQERAIQPRASPHGPPVRPGLLPGLPASTASCNHPRFASCQISALVDDSREQCQKAALREKLFRLANTVCWSPQAALGMIGYSLLAHAAVMAARSRRFTAFTPVFLLLEFLLMPPGGAASLPLILAAASCSSNVATLLQWFWMLRDISCSSCLLPVTTAALMSMKLVIIGHQSRDYPPRRNVVPRMSRRAFSSHGQQLVGPHFITITLLNLAARWISRRQSSWKNGSLAFTSVESRRAGSIPSRIPDTDRQVSRNDGQRSIPFSILHWHHPLDYLQVVVGCSCRGEFFYSVVIAE